MRLHATKSTVTDSLSLFDLQANLTMKIKDIFWTIDPLENLLNLDNIRRIFISETSAFSSSPCRVLRQSIAALPNFPTLKVFSLAMHEYNDYKVLRTPRDLRFVEAPICLILDIFARVLSTDEIARIKLKNSISGITQIPEMFAFHFKATRISTCGTLRITPAINKDKNAYFIASNEHLSKTFMNYDWITSDEGISFLTTVLALISQSDSNYIRMTKYNENTIPVFSASNRTTLTAMFSSFVDGTFNQISLLAGNTIDLTSKTLGLMIFINVVNQPVYRLDGFVYKIEGAPTFEIEADSQFYTSAIMRSYCDLPIVTEQPANVESVPRLRSRTKSKTKLSSNYSESDKHQSGLIDDISSANGTAKIPILKSD
jgi:hypothetical protein